MINETDYKTLYLNKNGSALHGASTFDWTSLPQAVAQADRMMNDAGTPNRKPTHWAWIHSQDARMPIAGPKRS